jgi:hypothetical protein
VRTRRVLRREESNLCIFQRLLPEDLPGFPPSRKQFDFMQVLTETRVHRARTPPHRYAWRPVSFPSPSLFLPPPRPSLLSSPSLPPFPPPTLSYCSPPPPPFPYPLFRSLIIISTLFFCIFPLFNLSISASFSLLGDF